MSAGPVANRTGWEEYGGVASLLANGLLLLPTSAVGLAANAFVLLAVWRQKSLQTCNNALLVNLAAGDVLRCAVDCPLLLAVVAAVRWGGAAPPLLCDAQLAAFSFSCCVQLLTLACISAERHQAVAQPFGTARRRRRLLVLIPATWAAAAAVAAVCLLYLKDSPVHVRCRGPGRRSSTSSYDTFGLYVLLPLWAACFAVISGFYARVFALVRAHNRKILDHGTFFTRPAEAEPASVAPEAGGSAAEGIGAPVDPTDEAKKASAAAPATPSGPTGSEAAAEVGKLLRITDLEAEQPSSPEGGLKAAIPERAGGAVEPGGASQAGDGGATSAPAAVHSIQVQGPVCMMPTKERKERASKSKESKMAKRVGYITATFLLFWLPLLSSILANFIAHRNRNVQSALIQDLEILTVSVACVTSLSDPIIYAAVNPQFRSEFERLRRKVESLFGEK